MHKNFRFSKFRGSTVSWDENEGVSSKVKVFFLMTQTVAMEITHQEKLVHRRDVDHRVGTSLSLYRHKNILYFICQVAKWKISYQEFLVMITRPLLHWYLYRIRIAKPPCLRHVLLFFSLYYWCYRMNSPYLAYVNSHHSWTLFCSSINPSCSQIIASPFILYTDF